MKYIINSFMVLVLVILTSCTTKDLEHIQIGVIVKEEIENNIEINNNISNNEATDVQVPFETVTE